MEESKKLKPAIFIRGSYTYDRANKVQESLLLKAMGKSDNPKVWKKMAGIQKMSELWKTLDKLSIRKEYHKALVRNGVDLDTIVEGIADIAKNGTETNRLKAWQTFLKSVGMDEYKIEEGGGGTGWEDMMRNIIEESPNGKSELDTGIEEYDVIEPEIPEEEQERMKEEREVGKSLYE
jgi:hypothetical protein